MDRILALNPKVLGGFDQAYSEEMLPDTVDRDARCERMLGRDQPLCKAQPIARRPLGKLGQKRGRIERHLIAGLEIFTSLEHLCFASLRIAHDHWTRDLVGPIRVQFIAHTLLSS